MSEAEKIAKELNEAISPIQSLIDEKAQLQSRIGKAVELADSWYDYYRKDNETVALRFKYIIQTLEGDKQCSP